MDRVDPGARLLSNPLPPRLHVCKPATGTKRPAGPHLLVASSRPHEQSQETSSTPFEAVKYTRGGEHTYEVQPAQSHEGKGDIHIGR